MAGTAPGSLRRGRLVQVGGVSPSAQSMARIEPAVMAMITIDLNGLAMLQPLVCNEPSMGRDSNNGACRIPAEIWQPRERKDMSGFTGEQVFPHMRTGGW
jgi:hypothetical protein